MSSNVRIDQKDLKALLNVPVKGKTAERPCECVLQTNILKNLRIKDEQDAINRYKWYFLPDGYSGRQLERMMWYKSQVALFYLTTLDRFFILPFVGMGCDYLGRPTEVMPIQWGSSQDDNDKTIKAFIDGKTFKPIYTYRDLFDTEGNLVRPIEECCVILRDYTEQLSFQSIPRSQLNDPILTIMSEVFPFARTSLIANSGTKGVRVGSEEEKKEIQNMNVSFANAAKTGQAFIPVVGNVDYQELGGGTPLKSEEYLLYMQALDNFRLSLYGIKTGGIFQKKSHMLQEEQEMNNTSNSMSYQDGLDIRQEFCDLVNFMYADLLGGNLVWCEASEMCIGDKNGNGILIDEQEQSGAPGEQPKEEIGGNEDGK